MAGRKKSTAKKSSAKKSASNRKISVSQRRKTSSGRRRSSAKKDSAPTMPPLIYAQASVHSIGGESMFDAGLRIKSDNVANYLSEESLSGSAVAQLQQAGFQVLQVSGSMINIAGSADIYEQAFGAPIEIHQRDVIKPFSDATVAEFLDCPNCDMPGLIATKNGKFANVLEGVAIEEPRYYMSPSAIPPTPRYWHLNVPDDVAVGCRAGPAHRAGITGKGVVVAMVDSGFYRHPFFTAHGYRADNALLGPGASNPADDESGHGTGESANIFALAPDVRLRPVKMSFVNSIGGFDLAVSLNPDIITCSWGSSVPNGPLSAANIALANAVATAVASGITVVFSAGNGHWGFPGQHPDVISAGGVFMDRDGSLKASDYSSGFMSPVYPGRRVPDLSGLVGMQPGARYIMLPVQPSDQIDRGSSGRVHPNGDETASDDGWAAFSGTSAAAPQLAGAAALIKQTCPGLNAAQIRDVLQSTATDVTEGQTHGNTGPNHAGSGPDNATGHGLINAHRATILARLRYRLIDQQARPPIRTAVQTGEPFRPIPSAAQLPVHPDQNVRSTHPVSLPFPPTGSLIASQTAAPCADNSMLILQQYAYQQGYEQAKADAKKSAAALNGNVDNDSLEESDLDALEDMILTGMVDPGEI